MNQKQTLHIYCRVSSSSQEDNTSLKQQEEKGRKLAETLGFDAEVWNEGVASSNKEDLENRPVLNTLLTKITKGEVQHLYSEYQDRLSRNPVTWGSIRYAIYDNNVNYYSNNDPNPVNLTNPIDELLFGMLAEIARFDNRTREQRLSAGKFQRVAEGKWQGGPPPFGYKISNHELVVDQFESEWVKQIYTSYLSGMSHRDIQDLLRSNGVKTRRGNTEFSLGSIDKILTNTHYSGSYTVTRQKTGETWQNTCPVIISKQLQDEVNKLKESRSRKRGKNPNQKYFYLLTDHLFCGDCGRKLRGRQTPSQKQFIYYCPAKEECWRRQESSDCNGVRSIKIQPTNQAVWKGVIDVIAKSHLFKESVKNAMLDEGSHQLSEKEIKSSKKAMRELDRKISKYTESIGNLKADLIMGDNKSELISTIKKLELDREKLQGQRDSTLQSINDSERGRRWVDWVAAFKNRINHLELIVDEVEQKQFIKEVVEKIEVVKGEGDEVKLNIHFTLPYYEDELVYRDLLDKKKGYEIVEGKSTYLIDYTSKKKI